MMRLDKYTRPSLAISVAALFISGSAAAQSPAEWNKVVADAEREGSVVLYSVIVPPVMQSVAAAFKKAYPKIEFQFIRNTEAVLIPKVEQEQSLKALAADLYTGTTYDFFTKQNAEGKL